VYTQETVRQDAALEERAQLTFYEPRHRTVAAALAGQEGFELRGDDAVEDVLFRIARAVAG
jgi:hypothetical protein